MFKRKEKFRPRPLAVSVETAQEISGLGEATINAAVKAGTLASIKIGRRRLIWFDSLERMCDPEAPR